MAVPQLTFPTSGYATDCWAVQQAMEEAIEAAADLHPAHQQLFALSSSRKALSPIRQSAPTHVDSAFLSPAFEAPAYPTPPQAARSVRALAVAARLRTPPAVTRTEALPISPRTKAAAVKAAVSKAAADATKYIAEQKAAAKARVAAAQASRNRTKTNSTSAQPLEPVPEEQTKSSAGVEMSQLNVLRLRADQHKSEAAADKQLVQAQLQRDACVTELAKATQLAQVARQEQQVQWEQVEEIKTRVAQISSNRSRVKAFHRMLWWTIAALCVLIAIASCKPAQAPLM